MKVRKSSTSDEVKKRKKAVLFCLSDDKKKIIVEEGKQILVGDIGETVDDPYACFVKLLPLNDCRYGLYDATYETKESKKEDLVFIFWYVVTLSFMLPLFACVQVVTRWWSALTTRDGFYYYFVKAFRNSSVYSMTMANIHLLTCSLAVSL